MLMAIHTLDPMNIMPARRIRETWCPSSPRRFRSATSADGKSRTRPAHLLCPPNGTPGSSTPHERPSECDRRPNPPAAPNAQPPPPIPSPAAAARGTDSRSPAALSGLIFTARAPSCIAGIARNPPQQMHLLPPVVQSHRIAHTAHAGDRDPLRRPAPPKPRPRDAPGGSSGTESSPGPPAPAAAGATARRDPPAPPGPVCRHRNASRDSASNRPSAAAAGCAPHSGKAAGKSRCAAPHATARIPAGGISGMLPSSPRYPSAAARITSGQPPAQMHRNVPQLRGQRWYFVALAAPHVPMAEPCSSSLVPTSRGNSRTPAPCRDS